MTPSRQRTIAEFVLDHLVWFMLAVVLVAFSLFVPNFFQIGIFANIIEQSTFVGVMAIGLAIVIIAGHMDLSVSLGIPGDYMHPRFAAAVDRIIDACRTRGKHVSCMAANPEAARVWIAKGVRIILYGTDVILLGGALRAGIEASRGQR